MSDASLIIRCDCHSPEHMLIFDVWHWDNEKPPHSELFVHMSLNTYMPWWKRLRHAISYVLGVPLRKYLYTETVIRREDAALMRDFLSEYVERAK